MFVVIAAFIAALHLETNSNARGAAISMSWYQPSVTLALAQHAQDAGRMPL